MFLTVSCADFAPARFRPRGFLALAVVVVGLAPVVAFGHADKTPGWVRSGLDGASGWTVAAAVAMAVGYGAAHALSPGHGKSMVAAYLVGREGRPRDAYILGLTITVAHTFTVFLVGIGFALLLGAGQGHHRVVWWLRTISGVVVLAMGLILFFSRVRAWIRGVSPHGHDHPHGGDGAHHHHAHGDHHHPVHGHDHPHPHDHGAGRDGGGLPLWQTVGLGLAGGAVPCPTALAMVGAGAALGHPLAALGLVVAFSGGLAISLTAVGLMIVRGSNWIDRVGWGRRAVRVAGVLGAVLLIAIGAVLTVTPTLEARHARASRVVVYP